MATPSKRILARQLEGVEKWLPAIEAAAQKYGFSTALMLAIGSRESNLNSYYQSHSGDGGNGYSMWQIDKRSYPAFVKSGDWRDVTKAVNKSASVLVEKRLEVRALKGRNLTAGSDAELRVAIAAYNTGSQRAVRGWNSYSDPDRATTGKDYSKDVIARQRIFTQLLAERAPAVIAVPTDLPGEVSVPAVVEAPEDTLIPSVQRIVTGHSDSIKAITARAGAKMARWVLMLWATTWGRTFLIIVSLVILTEIVYNVIKYWPKIKEAATKHFSLKENG